MSTQLTISSDEDLKELEQRIREDDLSLIVSLVVGRRHGDDKMPFWVKRDLCVLLHTRWDEMKSLREVYHMGGHSQEVMDAVAAIARDCPTVKSFELTLGDFGVNVTEEVAQAFCASHIENVKIYDGMYTAEQMRPLCKGLCSRQKPLHDLFFHSAIFDKDAMAMFAEALPVMDLGTLKLYFLPDSVPYVQQDFQRLFKSLTGCLKIRDVCLRLQPLGQGNAFRMTLDEPVFASILEAIQCMVSLRTLELGEVALNKDQWFRLGKALSRCLYMTSFNVSAAIHQVEVDAFLDGCEQHPRLLRLKAGAFFNLADHIRRRQTLRARCLTVLLVGSAIRRVGEHSSVYKIPSDIFRKLHSFLTED